MYHTTYLYVSIDQINSTRSNIGFTEVGTAAPSFRTAAPHISHFTGRVKSMVQLRVVSCAALVVMRVV